MRHLINTTVPGIVKTHSMIKKGRDKHIIKIPDSSDLYKCTKLHFAELRISLAEYYQCDCKNNTQKYG